MKYLNILIVALFVGMASIAGASGGAADRGVDRGKQVPLMGECVPLVIGGFQVTGVMLCP